MNFPPRVFLLFAVWYFYSVALFENDLEWVSKSEASRTKFVPDFMQDCECLWNTTFNFS